jgi:Lrp/AsnC family leucine-responsive transcriptional regulator
VRDDVRVEDLHSIAGDTHFLAKVRVSDPADLESLLYDLYRVEGVLNTRTRVVLRTHVDRPPAPDAPGVDGTSRQKAPGRRRTSPGCTG